jgi:hypothetical protein
VTKEELTLMGLKTKSGSGLQGSAQRLKAELLEQDIKRAAQAQIRHETAEAHVLVIKAIAKTLREKQAALVDGVWRPA